MKTLIQDSKIFFNSMEVSFIDWESELNGCITIFIGTALLVVKKSDLYN
jgi:hypothetical protein